MAWDNTLELGTFLSYPIVIVQSFSACLNFLIAYFSQARHKQLDLNI